MNAAAQAPESIAVIGMSGRFPGAASPEDFWRVLMDGLDAVEKFDPGSLEFTCATPDDLAAGRRFVSARGTLPDVDKFDAAFFGIYPREASLMDPQHRLFLECAWEALESAGHDPARFPGLIGVYSGVSLNTYLLWHLRKGRTLAGNYQVGEYQTMLGNDKDFVPVRVSYKLNLRGPSMGIQCACSTSLVAICQAATSLMAYQCDMALAGGSSISFPQRRDYPYEPDAMVSADGKCRAFDAGANGTIFGHGCGVVLLKRLGDALADRDPVLAVIRGWAVNNDGSEKVGFAAPSVRAQAEVIATAQAMAGVHPSDVSYIEAHGTGTPLGDPIEVAALTDAFRAGGATGNGFCALGSGKTNIGHLDVAAGATGLIKTLLQFRHGRIPALLHYTAPNPRIDFANSPFVPAAENRPWPRGDRPRIAGVSAFGVGGTNAHVVVEEPPLPPPSAPARDRETLLLSARSAAALDAMTARLADHLEQHPDLNLSDAAHTLAVGRKRMAFRRAVVARDRPDAVARLRAAVGGKPLELAAHAGAPKIVFLFPGQGAQFVGMGEDLYRAEPVFKSTVDECAELLRASLGADLRDTLYPAPGRREAAEARINETWLTQPAIFTIELAIARLWLARGVEPAMLIGHSIGEYVAAVLAGSLAPPDALLLLAERARLMMALPAGAMLAVRMPADEIDPLLPEGVAVAAINSPRLCTVSGPTPAVAGLRAALEQRGVLARMLPTSHAFHSAMMDPMLEPFARVAAALSFRAPAIPWVSTCLGREMTEAELADASYWSRQIRRPVLFGEALERAFALPDALLLEVGPGQALAQFARQHPARPPALHVVASLPGQEAGGRALDDFCLAAGLLWCGGREWDWARWFDGAPRNRLALPTYPFERQRHWIDAAAEEEGGRGRASAPPADAAAPRDLAGAEPEVVSAGEPAGVLPEVMDILHDLSGMDRSALDPQRAFLEMGFDSLFLTQVSLALQKKYQLKLTLRQMLDTLPTPSAIARHIAEQRPAPAAVRPAPAAEAPAGPFGPESAPPPAAPARHGPFAPINKAAGEALTPNQQRHLDALIARYTAKTGRSKEHTQRHRGHFSDPRAVAGFRSTWKEITYPIVSVRSKGSTLWDLDGNEYLDVTMGFGTYLFGHNPDFIRAAIEAQLRKGIEIGPQNVLAGDIARVICELSGMDRATFCTTGSEAVMGAVRAARTVTGRAGLVYFSGDYHGIHEEVLAKGLWAQGRSRTLPIAPGIPPELVSQAHVLNYGDPASLEWIKANAESVAAVLVEPVQSRKPELQPREFVKALRALTEQAGIALIFDEIVTGFRLDLRGAQAFYGVQADLVTYGKIVGGGLPIGVIAGKRAYLDAFDGGLWRYGDDSVPEAGVTFFAGTFVRHPLAMASAKAVLDHLLAEGPDLQRRLNERAGRFVDEMNRFFADEGVDLWINRCASIWYLGHGERVRYFSMLFHYLRDLGIHIWEGRPCFFCTEHTEPDVARLADAIKRAVREMREAGFLPGRVPDVPATGPFALTEAQQEIWLTSRLDPLAAPAFNESCALTFRGPLDRAALGRALSVLVQRHEALRTVLAPSGERQEVLPSAEPALRLEDLRALGEREREARLAAIVREEVGTPFDLGRAPLLRARLVALAERLHVLALTVHHAVCDGWSYDVMTRDLGALYSLACRGEQDNRPPPTQFRHYARRLAEYRAEPRYEADLGYWLDLHEQAASPVRLPSARRRPPLRTFAGAMEVAPIDEALLNEVKEMGARHRATLFATLMAMYAVQIHRLTGQRDFVIGIPAAGQQIMEDHALVGHCANLLPLRLRVAPEDSFSRLLAAAQQALLDAYEHQGITFGALLKALKPAREPSHPPLIQVTFNVDPAMHGLRFEGLDTDVVINPRAAYQFEHSLNIVAYTDRLRLECNYNTDLFDAPTIRRWLDQYRGIAQAVARQPDCAVGDIPLMDETERRIQLFEWNRTAAAYPAACIHELFAEQAARAPDRVALVAAGRTMTYGELDRLSNRLARHLVARGVRPDQAVGVCADRSIEMVAGLLGILKAGGAYLPLDPSHPMERLRLQATDARARLVVASGRCEAVCRALELEAVLVDDPRAAWRGLAEEALSSGELGAAHRPSQLAYILYTSGSTGRPKGVLIEHRGVVRLVRSVSYVKLGPDERMVHLSPLAFDASTFELWGALLHGARLAILPPGPFSMAALTQLLRDERPTILWITTRLFHALVDDALDALAPIRQVLTGGEITSGERINRALRRFPELAVIHCYGPTEGTTFTTAETYRAGAPAEEPPPLGRPIENTQVYVLDERLQPVPVGVTGEICVGGDGLARGYLNRPEQDAAAFVRNPLDGTPGGRLYRTGDLGRWRSDGRLEFLGRRDGQVKIRGFRIEPGEIEAVLSGFPGIQSCAVAPRDDASGEKQLVAYVAMRPGEPTPAAETLRQYLRQRVPEFMAPAVFSIQDALPLTASGKVDRNALPEPARAAPGAEAGFVAPRNEAEAAVAAACSELLGVPRVGAGDDFFALGGHSLAAVKLIARLADAGYALEVADLFLHSTVERMAAAMKPVAGGESGRVIAREAYAVRLRDGRAGAPTLCLLPSDFGDLLIYSNLIPLLAPDIPCIGLQCPRLYENNEGLDGMEGLAAFFARHLLAAQPRGPFVLAGYCFGGHVALELARQLRAAGHDVALLCMIDARPFRPRTNRSRYLGLMIKGAVRARPSDWARHFRAKWAMSREARLTDRMARARPDQLDRRELNRWILETRILASYRSAPYSGDMAFFYPAESHYELYGDPSCGWLDLADRVYLVKVPGSHLDMMRDPHAREFCDKLEACWRQVAERRNP